MTKDIIVRSEEDLASHKGINILGKDLTKIPCFRSSFICGICTGVAGGLGSFLMTSKTLFSTHVAFASLWVGVLVYWFPCRYKYESKMSVHHTITEKLVQKGEIKPLQEDESS